MASVITLLAVDIVGVLAALSIWTASFLLLLRNARDAGRTRWGAASGG
jgi:hypothetical protein